MHSFTLIQCFAVAALWGVKLSPASIAYPVAIVLLIPAKNLLSTYLFTNKEMEAVSQHHHNNNNYYIIDSLIMKRISQMILMITLPILIPLLISHFSIKLCIIYIIITLYNYLAQIYYCYSSNVNNY